MTREAIVHIIDDDEAARDSLAFLLEIDGLVVSSYESAVAFVDARPSTDGGCIVTDLRMPGMDGIGLLRHLRAQGVGCPVVVITGHGDIPLAIEAIESGAFDFIEKPYNAEMLLGAVRAALDPREDGLTNELARESARDTLATLSDHERRVFDRMVLGHLNSAIARELIIDERVVEIHRANVMTKMNAPNLSGLVRLSLIAK